MAKLNIPPRHIPGFKILYELSDDDFNKLIKAISDLPLGVAFPDYSKQISEVLNLSDEYSLSSALFAFGPLLSENPSIEQLANDISESYNKVVKDETGVSVNVDKLQDRIVSILQTSENTKITYDVFKTVAISANLFQESEILTELKIIMADSDMSFHGSICHHLKITFQRKDESENRTYLMDSADLAALKAQIEKALIREENIKNNSKVNIVDLSR